MVCIEELMMEGFFTAKAWHNGKNVPGGYGLRFSKGSREFLNGFKTVELELPTGSVIDIGISPSFKRDCPELRSAEIGRWLLLANLAPWPKGDPPEFRVHRVSGHRFRVS